MLEQVQLNVGFGEGQPERQLCPIQGPLGYSPTEGKATKEARLPNSPKRK